MDLEILGYLNGYCQKEKKCRKLKHLQYFLFGVLNKKYRKKRKKCVIFVVNCE